MLEKIFNSPLNRHDRLFILYRRFLIGIVCLVLVISMLALDGCTLFEPGVARRILRLDEISKDMDKGVDYHNEQQLKEEQQALREQYRRRAGEEITQ
ncbi:MAG: hypothetical protein JW709_08545 [Sedimentisphaerales bacterium]|nr:hypothetical protein [Sedimentisphaerales bacterium]